MIGYLKLVEYGNDLSSYKMYVFISWVGIVYFVIKYISSIISSVFFVFIEFIFYKKIFSFYIKYFY